MDLSERAKLVDTSSLNYTGLSDSEDDFSSAFGNDTDALDNYNVSDKLKNLLRLGNFRLDNDLVQLDDESEDDSILNPIREASKRVPIESKPSESKYMNFPLKPPTEETPEKKKKKGGSKVNKMKRREKEKQKKSKNIDDILEDRPRHDVHEYLNKLRLEDSDNEEGQNKRSKKKTGRRTRKVNAQSIDSMVDENGERLVRTTELLDSSEDDSEDDRPLSKKEELEMYREKERMLRSAEVKIKPTIKIKTFEDFIKRREQREKEDKLKKDQEIERERLQQIQDESSDSDIEIIYDKKSLLTSPERPRQPPSLAVSPIRNGDASKRNFNASLLRRIYEQTHEHRKAMEEAAKASGHFVSASDRAQRLIEQERRAKLINQQIEHHFSRKPESLFGNTGDDDEEEEEDPDYDDNTKMSEDENDNISDNNDNDNNNKNHESNDEDDSEMDNDDNHMSESNVYKADNDENDILKSKDNNDIVDNQQEEVETEPSVIKRPKRRILSDSEESDSDEDSTIKPHIQISNMMNTKIHKHTQKKPQEKNDYVVEEAEEEDDEYFGMGGPDVEETEDLDQYEQDGILVESNEETDNIDKAALRAMFYEQDAESDRNMVQRLLKDITSGGLRKRKAALEEGFMFDDIEIYDDDNDLIAVRKAAAAKRRKMLQEHGGALEALAQDPRTAAFVRAARATMEDTVITLSDDSGDEKEEEEEEDEHDKSKNAHLIEDDEDDDDLENYIVNSEEREQEETSDNNKVNTVHLSDDDDDDDIAPYALA